MESTVLVRTVIFKCVYGFQFVPIRVNEWITSTFLRTQFVSKFLIVISVNKRKVLYSRKTVAIKLSSVVVHSSVLSNFYLSKMKQQFLLYEGKKIIITSFNCINTLVSVQTCTTVSIWSGKKQRWRLKVKTSRNFKEVGELIFSFGSLRLILAEQQML